MGNTTSSAFPSSSPHLLERCPLGSSLRSYLLRGRASHKKSFVDAEVETIAITRAPIRKYT